MITTSARTSSASRFDRGLNRHLDRLLRRRTTEYDGNEPAHWFEAFYRTGSIIFGGGQVVLPLLLRDVVQYRDTCALRPTAHRDPAAADVSVSTASYEPWFARTRGSPRSQFFAGSAC